MLVPLRVTVLTPAPVKLPWRTSYGATLTCTCSIASSEIGATPVRSPMPPVVAPRPNELLKYEPSTVMLFVRLSWPANVPMPPYCGVSRVMSVMRPVIGRQRREVLAHHGGGRAGARRAEHRIARADDGDRFGDGRDLEREVEILRDAEATA